MSGLTVQPFQLAWADELVRLWLASYEQGVGVPDPYTFDEQKAYLLEEVVPDCEVRVALADGELVGFIAATPDRVGQLFVRIDCQGIGVGSHLLDWAKTASHGALELWVHAGNHSARRFYERRGFVRDGEAEGPAWRSRKLRYRWAAND